MQITGMSIKNVKALFLILNHCKGINSKGIKQQLLLSRKFNFENTSVKEF